MSRTVKIPDSPSPFRCVINNTAYEYKAGITTSVPDSVADLIDAINALKPIEDDPTFRIVTEIGDDPTDKQVGTARATVDKIRSEIIAADGEPRTETFPITSVPCTVTLSEMPKFRTVSASFAESQMGNYLEASTVGDKITVTGDLYESTTLTVTYKTIGLFQEFRLTSVSSSSMTGHIDASSDLIYFTMPFITEAAPISNSFSLRVTSGEVSSPSASYEDGTLTIYTGDYGSGGYPTFTAEIGYYVSFESSGGGGGVEIPSVTGTNDGQDTYSTFVFAKPISGPSLITLMDDYMMDNDFATFLAAPGDTVRVAGITSGSASIVKFSVTSTGASIVY